jgi:hypothetical protein
LALADAKRTMLSSWVSDGLPLVRVFALALAVTPAGCRDRRESSRALSTSAAPKGSTESAASGASTAQAYETDAASRAEPGSPTPARRVQRIIVGDSWGCAEIDHGDDTAHQYCWTTPVSGSAPESKQAPVARRVPWLPVSAVADAERICVRDGQGVKCWVAREFFTAAPADLPERKTWRAQGEQTRHARGIWASNHVACALEGRRVVCQGSDEFGQLASGQPPLAGDGVTSHTLALGRFHACSSRDLDLDCWGRADHGQLGAQATSTCQANGRDVACSRVPLQVKVPKHDLAGTPRLVAGDLFTCAIWSEFAECWGASRDGFFGTKGACDASLKTAWPTQNGSVAAPRAACSPTPVRVPGLRIRHLAKASAGPRGLCINDPFGGATCVGAIKAPRGVSSISVSSGDDASACGVSAGSVVCWGAGYSPSRAPDQKVSVQFEQAPKGPSVPVLDQKGSWDQGCMIHHACTRDVEAIPHCEPSKQAEAWVELAPQASERRGQLVSVRGNLTTGPGAVTMAGCARTLDKVDPDPSRVCCNYSGAPVILEAPKAPLSLEWLDCRGDDSRSCCNVPALGRDVVASGKLEWSDQGIPGWVLRQPELCWK